MDKVHNIEGAVIEVPTGTDIRELLLRVVRWLLGIGIPLIVAASLWAARVENQIDTINKQGSMPMQALIRQTDSLRFVIRNQSEVLVEVRDELRRIRR